jgi:hypothetical protein
MTVPRTKGRNEAIRRDGEKKITDSRQKPYT